METCRTISEKAWIKAHARLVFYFSRGQGADRAEDLAQRTLAAVWGRPDYEFEKEDDFVPVCLGFARRIALEARRENHRYSGGEVSPDLPVPKGAAESSESAEFRLLFAQIMQTAKKNLSAREYQLIVESVNQTGSAPPGAQEANRRRVSLFRAIQKLRRILGAATGT